MSERVRFTYTRGACVVAVGIVVVAALFCDPLHAGTVDDQFAALNAARSAAFGGSLFAHATSGRGVVVPALDQIAARVAPENFPYLIALLVAGSAGVIAVGAARVVRGSSRSGVLALCAAVAVFVFFTLSNAPFAGVLSSAIVGSAFITLALLIVFRFADPAGSRASAAAVVIGVAIGLAMLTTSSLLLVGAVPSSCSRSCAARASANAIRS